MIKTIIFDIGGVITETNFQALYTDFAKQAGLKPEFVVQYHKDKMNDMLLGNINLDQFWQDMRKAGADPKLDLQAIWIEVGLKNLAINQELLMIIEKLRKNYSVGTLTNLTPSRQILDEKIDLFSHFDYAILSCLEHLKKPDPAFYRLALKVASVKPEEVIFIDDKAVCVTTAEDLGMKGLIYSYPDNEKLVAGLRNLGISI